jgi:frataxin-like iron-binding protein CyaY
MSDSDFESRIRERIKKGFEEWNSGYDAWLEWCETLYEPDAHYNIGLKDGMRRLDLQEYKDMMGEFFSVMDIDLGNFYNMIVEGDWAGIRYQVFVTNKQTGERYEQMTMEWVHFKDNPEPIGARIIEGFALSDLPVA